MEWAKLLNFSSVEVTIKHSPSLCPISNKFYSLIYSKSSDREPDSITKIAKAEIIWPVRIEQALLSKFRDQCVTWLIQDNIRFPLGWYGSPQTYVT